MPIIQLEPSRKPRRSPSTSVEPSGAGDGPVSSVPGDQLAEEQQHPAARSAEMRFIDGIRAEVDRYHTQLRTLNSLDPDQVFYTLSAITARLAEMRTQLWRLDGSRRCQALRSREVDPLIDEADRQFKIHSRIQAVRMFDWEVSGKGQV